MASNPQDGDNNPTGEELNEFNIPPPPTNNGQSQTPKSPRFEKQENMRLSKEDSMRTQIFWGILILFALTITVPSGILIWGRDAQFPAAEKILTMLLPVFSALVSAIITYYFTRKD